MSERYSKKDAERIGLLLKQLWHKCKERRFSFRTVAPHVEAEATTVWRWHKGISLPSEFHVHHIKKFLGYV